VVVPSPSIAEKQQERMKSYIFMTAVVLSLSAGTLAQDRAIQPDVEAALPNELDSHKVPMMVVREAPEKPKIDTALSGKAALLSAKAGGGKNLSRPLVMGATIPATFSAGDATTGNLDYDRLVLESSARNGIDPALMVEVIRQESGFNAHAHSYKGACGLMQLMPGTAARFGVTKIFDPAQNIEAGAKYLRFLLDKFDGDVQLALAGYNAGENAVVGAGYRVPRYRETQAYVHNISSRYGSTEKANRSKQPAQAVPNKPLVIPSGPNGTLSNNY
jgi:soluble lytic murein transglycosylase-like protein